MRRVLALALLAIAFSLSLPTLASADLRSSHSILPSFSPGQGGYTHQIGVGGYFRKMFGGKKSSSGRPAGQQNQAPELDATGVGSAAILLIGGSLVLMDRRRRARKRSNRPS
jgi:hypothetical protein